MKTSSDYEEFLVCDLYKVHNSSNKIQDEICVWHDGYF